MVDVPAGTLSGGLNAHFTLDKLAAEFARLREAALDV
jgi:hypothetical protein